ncbi:hypothetical protein C0991_012061 [Blastosporella zonata]|nr:hypothetical protein C0991_012061 [Blastosporella zonata]
MTRHDVAKHIKTLILRPNDLVASTDGWLDADAEISQYLERIVPTLSALETFVWDGVEPPEETLWVALRAQFPPLEISNSDVVINEFSGTHFYLGYVLPSSQLTALKLCSERLQTWRLVDLLPCLKGLPHLATLELWIDMSHRINSSTLVGHPPAKNAALMETNHIKKDFWRAIESGPRLRTLEVQKVHSFNEEKMARSALQIARRVPTLQAITLVYAEHSWLGLIPIRIKQMGVYDINAGNKDNLVRVTAEESGKGLFKKPFSRRTTRTYHWQSPAQRVGLS